jgi:hypothetical protein
MEYLFDLEGAVEAIEKRVPFGHTATKLVLSLAVIYALFLLLRALALDLFYPLAHVITLLAVQIFSSERIAIPRVNVASGSIAAALFGAAMGWVLHAQEVAYARIKVVEAALENYRGLFWERLPKTVKTELIAQLAALGKHQVLLTTHVNPDCVSLGRELQECFKAAGWDVVDRPLTEATTREIRGMAVFSEDTVLTEKVVNALTAPYTARDARRMEAPAHLQPTQNLGAEVWVIVGPKGWA